MTTTQEIRQTVHQLMPTVIENLKQLVRIPSVATQGYPHEQVLEAARATEAQLGTASYADRNGRGWQEMSILPASSVRQRG